MATKLTTTQLVLVVAGVISLIGGAITILFQFWQPKPSTTGSS